jgi:hypothetical protein
MAMKYVFLLLFVLAPLKSWAYPNFVGFGYKNCMTCHYNPFGNGPLNDYGRAVSANVVSDRLLVPRSITDEDLGDRSNFLMMKKAPTKWIRPAFDWRNIFLKSGVNSENSTEQDFLMQREAHLTLKFGARDNVVVSGSYTSLPADNVADGQEAETYSREHYIGVRIGNNAGVYVGKMDKVFGIRVIDHIAFSRGGTATATTSPTAGSHDLHLGFDDQVHGAVFHYGTDTWELGYQYILGDRDLATEFHYTGHSAKLEYTLHEKIRIGGSFLTTSKEEQEEDQTIMSFLTMLQMGKGSSILFEYGNSSTEKVGLDPNTSSYMFVQSSVHLRRGLFYLMTFETVTPDADEPFEIYRIAPGIQWFPIQRIEIRMDLQNTRIYAEGKANEEDWRFIGQMHLWF